MCVCLLERCGGARERPWLASVSWHSSQTEGALTSLCVRWGAGTTKELDKKYQAMERDRKSYTDESQNVIRKQRCVTQRLASLPMDRLPAYFVGCRCDKSGGPIRLGSTD